jgi:sialate O-acetylesterase
VQRAREYPRLFRLMVADWRAWFERELPIGFVQLPGYEGYRPRFASAELRDAQRRTLAVPGTGMVVSIDLSDGRDIHGADKRAVGVRLAGWALRHVYGRTGVPSGSPTFREMVVRPWGIEVAFDHAEGGLVAPDGRVAGFEVAGDDGKFVPAWGVVSGSSVILRSSVVQPTAVRYGWADVPAATLRGANGLPAAPFRSDDWIAAADAALRAEGP